MAHNLYSGFAIEDTFMSTTIIGRLDMQRHYLSAILLTSLSIFAQLPTLRLNIFSTKTLLAFWVIPNWFSKFCSQNDHLNSKLMLRWDSPFNPRPAGSLDFPRPAGGGGCLNTPPSISAPAHRRTKRKTAFESSRKIISKSFRSFFGSGQNWGHQGSKFQNFPKRVLDDTIFICKGRATILAPSCLSRQGASNHV